MLIIIIISMIIVIVSINATFVTIIIIISSSSSLFCWQFLVRLMLFFALTVAHLFFKQVSDASKRAEQQSRGFEHFGIVEMCLAITRKLLFRDRWAKRRHS